ncbi:MAG: hypothetical protein K8R54_15780 [Bacteroidales bacterium]|nr:hypothetical protein [Bacteroidales bacterium]
MRTIQIISTCLFFILLTGQSEAQEIDGYYKSKQDEIKKIYVSKVADKLKVYWLFSNGKRYKLYLRKEKEFIFPYQEQKWFELINSLKIPNNSVPVEPASIVADNTSEKLITKEPDAYIYKGYYKGMILRLFICDDFIIEASFDSDNILLEKYNWYRRWEF